MGYNETTWKFPVSWGLRARVVTRPTIRQQKHRTCETGFTHTVHLNIVILNMSEYGEGGSGQILFVLRRNFPNPPIRLCNILISPHPLIGSQVSLAPLLPPPPPPPFVLILLRSNWKPCQVNEPKILRTGRRLWLSHWQNMTVQTAITIFWKQFSFKERMTEKDVKNFMTDRFSILALLLALYLLSWFYSLTRNIFYTI